MKLVTAVRLSVLLISICGLALSSTIIGFLFLHEKPKPTEALKADTFQVFATVVGEGAPAPVRKVAGVGTLIEKNTLELESNNTTFGGLSGASFGQNDAVLYTVSDTGMLFKLNLSRKRDGSISKVSGETQIILDGESGNSKSNSNRWDMEAVSYREGVLFIAHESGQSGWCRLKLDNDGICVNQPVSAAVTLLPKGQGLESIVWAEGRVTLAAEQQVNKHYTAWTNDPVEETWHESKIKATPGYRLTDIDYVAGCGLF